MTASCGTMGAASPGRLPLPAQVNALNILWTPSMFTNVP